MKYLDRLLGGDKEERSSDVRALHAALRSAADRPLTEANGAWYLLMAQAQLWTFTVGEPASAERLVAQARLSGSAEMSFRASRTRDGETYLPAATTRRRLVRSGLGKPGNSMVRLPFRVLAYAAESGGLDALVINPGTVPFGHVAGPGLTAFADGGIPDPAAPEQRLTVDPDQRGPIESLDMAMLPEGLLDAAKVATRAEPQIAAASLVVCALGRGRLYLVLAVVPDRADQQSLTDRLAARTVDSIDSGNYLAVEYVAPDDPRLADPGRAAVLIPM